MKKSSKVTAFDLDRRIAHQLRGLADLYASDQQAPPSELVHGAAELAEVLRAAAPPPPRWCRARRSR